MARVCACGDRWLLETCDLLTGQVRGVLHPIDFEWSSELNKLSGTSTITLPTRDLRIRDVWPHLTAVYISRLDDPDTGVWGGMIETVTADDNGTLKLGLVELGAYLKYRVMFNGGGWQQVQQTQIGAELMARGGGPNKGIYGLTATYEASSQLRDRTWYSWDKKNVGEAVEELPDLINGPDFEVVHSRAGGAWSTQYRWRDWVGEDRNVILQSDREAQGYGLTIDAQNHTTVVYAVGAGDGSSQLVASATDPLDVYPHFDTAPAWSDVSELATLQAYADNTIAENSDPVATPSATLVGPDQPDVRLGDTVHVSTDYGAMTYHGDARVLTDAWSVAVDQAETRSLGLTPLERALTTVLNQTPNDPPCERCNR